MACEAVEVCSNHGGEQLSAVPVLVFIVATGKKVESQLSGLVVLTNSRSKSLIDRGSTRPLNVPGEISLQSPAEIWRQGL